jgi:hypothetical protein
MRSSKQKIVFFASFFFTLFLISSTAQAQQVDVFGLPLGTQNTLGIYSPYATATGETILSNPGPQAGFLNPGVLGFSNGLQISLSSPLYQAFSINHHNYNNEQMKYTRNTFNPEFIGFLWSSAQWRMELAYTLIEEFNRPKIFNYGNFDAQNGRLHAFELGLSRRIRDNFSMGLSLTYRTGQLKHTRYYYYADEDIDYKVNITGFNLNFGFVWEVNKTITLALAIRPAYKMKIKEEIKEVLLENDFIISLTQFEANYRFPMALILSSKIKVSENIGLFSDLSYWNWKQFSCSDISYDLSRLYVNPQDHDPLKLSAGADYALRLGSTKKNTLHLLAGYIHDPQGYSGSNSPDYLTFGLAIALRNFQLEGSAKLPLAPVGDPWSIYSSCFQLGMNFRL